MEIQKSQLVLNGNSLQEIPPCLLSQLKALQYDTGNSPVYKTRNCIASSITFFNQTVVLNSDSRFSWKQSGDTYKIKSTLHNPIKRVKRDIKRFY